MQKQGFDNQIYITRQSEEIQRRIQQFGGKLYLEFGGKLFDDYHASRVLPGFAPDSKIQMLKSMADKAEIIIAINAGDIVKNKIRGDLGITYDQDVLRLIDAFREFAASFPPRPSSRSWRSWACGSTGIIPSRAIPITSPASSARRALAKTSLWRPSGRWWW